jgi:hypothetical protein
MFALIQPKLFIMQRSIIMRVSLCLLLLALALPMCTKQGPAGTTGATGAAGPQGPTGPQGPKGDTGTANVIYSQWVGGISGVTAFWYIPALTQGMFDSAAILLYAQSQYGFIYQLPFYYDSVNYLFDVIQPGGAALFCSGNLDFYTYRYVIIPSGVEADDIQQGYRHIAAKFNITP